MKANQAAPAGASALAGEVRKALEPLADAERGAGQQAYMKSAMPFLGIRVPQVRKVSQGVAKGVNDPAVLRLAAQMLWEEAEVREHWYAALALMALRPNRGRWENVQFVEQFVRAGQWWDITDDLAKRLADLLDSPEHAARSSQLVRSWAHDDDFWIRRIAILSQLGRHQRLDRELLAAAIEPNLGDQEFFIRKAIGWALREAAKGDPAWVRDFVASHELSPLSRREAMKHLGA